MLPTQPPSEALAPLAAKYQQPTTVLTTLLTNVPVLLCLIGEVTLVRSRWSELGTLEVAAEIEASCYRTVDGTVLSFLIL